MLSKEIINKKYIDYRVYSVLKLKDKYGFKIKLIYSDNSKEIKQIGGFKRKKDAIAEQNKIIGQLQNQTYVIYPKIKYEEYIRFWLEEIMRPKITYNAYMSYRNIVENYAVPFFENLYLNQINLGHIQKFYNDTAKKYASIAKIAKTVINTSFEYAKTKNLISVNPSSCVNLPKEIKKNTYKLIEIDIKKTLNIEQCKILINESKNTPIYLHILFALLMGLRKQEINGIKYSDIDFINRKLYIQRQLGIDPNKSKEDCPPKTYTKQEIQLKTYSSERILDIPDLVFEAILEQKAKYCKNKSRRKNDKHNPFIDSGYVCCSTYGHPRSKDFHTRYYKKLLKDNDLPKIRFHDLRHTYTTLLLMNNYNLKAISETLGHASTIITANNYFDKEKIIIDCTKELDEYVDKVKPIERDKNNDFFTPDLDTNLLLNDYILNL